MTGPDPNLLPILNEGFRRYLMKRCLPIVGDWHLAEEIVSETMLALCKTRSYDPSRCSPSTFGSWRFRGVLTSFLAMRDRRHHIHAAPLASDPAARSERDIVELRDSAERVSRVLQTLPDRHRRVMEATIDGQSMIATSQELGICRQRVHQIVGLATCTVLKRVNAGLRTA